MIRSGLDRALFDATAINEAGDILANAYRPGELRVALLTREDGPEPRGD